ncbi:DNA-binding protein [Dietzia cercidiphylli]|uniref:DNA-binding protein n=1 Tax=Dietzia cercidiphylli TaxID=498199 RepID=UPI00223AB75D|nr:DNA-binding protein [Dietzia cercidiphylli]MCT1514512.1 DNA-binding protein [Dietzia cercidiphylli]
MSTSEKIARAYGVLVARGDKVTVRSVQREAGVRICEVAAWMREYAAGVGGDVPPAPDLSEAMSAMVASVWAAAWTRAAEQADEQAAVALDAARGGEADALEAAEQAESQRDDAVAVRDRALGELEVVRGELEQLRGQLETARQDAAVARAKAEESDRARVRAEATSDTLREVLDSLHETARKPGQSDQPGQS